MMLAGRELRIRSALIGGLVAVLLFLAAGRVQAQAAGGHAQAIADLQATVVLLEKADHDYQGHRVKAIAEVRTAIRDLEGAGKGSGKVAGRGEEKQGVSDEQLRAALKELRAVKTGLEEGKRSKRVTRAVNAIGKAIGELETALSIR
jgi:hypothetical protein